MIFGGTKPKPKIEPSELARSISINMENKRLDTEHSDFKLSIKKVGSPGRDGDEYKFEGSDSKSGHLSAMAEGRELSAGSNSKITHKTRRTHESGLPKPKGTKNFATNLGQHLLKKKTDKLATLMNKNTLKSKNERPTMKNMDNMLILEQQLGQFLKIMLKLFAKSRQITFEDIKVYFVQCKLHEKLVKKVLQKCESVYREKVQQAFTRWDLHLQDCRRQVVVIKNQDLTKHNHILRFEKIISSQ